MNLLNSVKIGSTSIAISLLLCNSSISAPRTWGSAEYLYWWLQDGSFNAPLIAQFNDPTAGGTLDEIGTQVIYGSGSNNNATQFGGFNGGRLTLGRWIDDCNRYGIEGSGFALQRKSDNFGVSTDNIDLFFTIPFFALEPYGINPITGLPNPAGEGSLFLAGDQNTVTVQNKIQTWGVELNGLFNFSNELHFPLIGIAGFRYLNLNEQFSLTDSAIYTASAFSPDTNGFAIVSDNFQTKNQFYGFQIGARSNMAYKKATLDLTGKIAIGENYETLKINGQTTIRNSPDPIFFPDASYAAGVFAQPSNSGSFNNRQFAVIPEVQAKLGYFVTPHIHPFLAYNFLCIDNVIRPGDQINRFINPSENPALAQGQPFTGIPAPLRSFTNTSIWMQGVSAGIEFSC